VVCAAGEAQVRAAARESNTRNFTHLPKHSNIMKHAGTISTGDGTRERSTGDATTGDATPEDGKGERVTRSLDRKLLRV
jgi:hypothetical protein